MLQIASTQVGTPALEVSTTLRLWGLLAVMEFRFVLF